MTKKNVISSCCSAVIVAAIAACTSCSGGNGWQMEQGMVWNTTYHITYKGAAELKDSVLKVLGEIGKSLNVFDGESLVSRVNITDSTAIDTHFRSVYTMSQLVNTASGGMFDPTLSPLITAWGFGPGHEMTADTLAVDSILRFTGIGKTHLSGDYLVKEDIRTQFNFSAVAKGYGCDAIGTMLARNGVNDYMIEIGGEIAASGMSPRGGGWRISIDRPVESATEEIHDAVTVIEVNDAGIATSGNYRNFHKQGNKTLGHTISPLTGRPVQTDVISATVIAPTAMEADAAATACMASGSAKSKEMLASLRLEGMLILSDSTIWTTPGFDKLCEKSQGARVKSQE